MLWSRQSYVETILEDIDVVMSIGICPHEKYPDRPQHVLVSVKLYQQIDRIEAKDIKDCINYAVIHDFVAGWRDRPHVDLLETLAEELAEKCLEDSRIDACWLSIRKPDIYHDTQSVGIQVYRTRKEAAA